MTDCTCNHFPANLDPVVFDTRVGIGEADPQQRLHIVGQMRFDHPAQAVDYRIGPGWQLADDFAIARADIPYIYVLWDGKVGIGTTSPGQKLHVSSGNILIDNNQGYQIKQSGGAATTILTLDGNNVVKLFDGGGGFVARLSGGGLSVGYEHENPPGGGLIVTGKVGIGKPDPGEKLDVNGNIKLSGSLFAGARKVADSGGCYYAE